MTLKHPQLADLVHLSVPTLNLPNAVIDAARALLLQSERQELCQEYGQDGLLEHIHSLRTRDVS